uniref:SGNH hydrolase-type esterase domain-containing protein n=1 Tax=Denticeps clupeoides TaxID=299321 RepID=A0AAY4DLP4_9TELE
MCFRPPLCKTMFDLEKHTTSRVTGRRHRLVIPAGMPEEKFAFLVGDNSHLRAIVDGFVAMREVLNAVLPRNPEVVCVLAPSNNLSARKSVNESGVDFRRLLTTLCGLWRNVVVLDFPPRLTVAEADQDRLWWEYACVAAQEGMYKTVLCHFLRTCLNLWCRDGIHLSDSAGMKVLAWLLWDAVSLQLEAPAAPSPPRVAMLDAPKTPPRVVRRSSPKVVVVGKERLPCASDPFEWTLARRGQKVIVALCNCVASILERWMFHQIYSFYLFN